MSEAPSGVRITFPRGARCRWAERRGARTRPVPASRRRTIVEVRQRSRRSTRMGTRSCSSIAPTPGPSASTWSRERSLQRSRKAQRPGARECDPRPERPRRSISQRPAARRALNLFGVTSGRRGSQSSSPFRLMQSAATRHAGSSAVDRIHSSHDERRVSTLRQYLDALGARLV